MTQQSSQELSDSVFANYHIQIETIVQKSFEQLKQRFPEHTTKADYDVLLRAFSPIIDIINFRLQESHMHQMLRCVVCEEFGYDSPPAILAFQRRKGKKTQPFDYQREVGFLQTLKEIPFTREVFKAMNGRSFEEWYDDEHALGDFFSSLKKNYPEVFSYFSEEDTKEQLKEIMHFTYERRKRAGTLQDWLKQHWQSYRDAFSSHLEAKLFSLVLWQETQADSWHKTYAPDLGGMQKIIVAEIVPKGLPNYHGPVGGKTIKIGRYDDLNTAFIHAQAYQLSMFEDFSLFADARDSFFLMLVARRYIFKEAIDLLLNYREKQLDESFENLRENHDFRRIMYKMFHYHADTFLKKFYGLYALQGKYQKEK